MKKDKILGRLKQFQRMLKLSNEEFSAKLGFTPSNLNNFFKGKWIESSKASELHKLGLNINWLVSGVGEMTNNSIYGANLLKELINTQNFNPDKQYSSSTKLFNWIIYNFDSLDKFAEKTSFPLNELQNTIDNNDIYSIKLLSLLEKEGCNLRWIYSQDQEPYKDNINGRKLRSILLKNGMKSNPLYSSILESRTN